jgi:hypothetical protein
MNEAEWLRCAGPSPMLEFLKGKVSERQLRLFASACCRRVWGLIGEKGRKGVEVAEQYADGTRCQRTLCRAWTAAQAEARKVKKRAAECASLAAARAVAPDRRWEPTRLNASAAALAAAWAVKCRHRGSNEALSAESKAQADLLRDIFNPWLPSIPPALLAWNDGAVARVAQMIYQDNEFGDLPILADALEEAGCTNADILNHLRSPGPHVRGCWAVDLLSGRT